MAPNNEVDRHNMYREHNHEHGDRNSSKDGHSFHVECDQDGLHLDGRYNLLCPYTIATDSNRISAIAHGLTPFLCDHPPESHTFKAVHRVVTSVITCLLNRNKSFWSLPGVIAFLCNDYRKILASLSLVHADTPVLIEDLLEDMQTEDGRALLNKFFADLRTKAKALLTPEAFWLFSVDSSTSPTTLLSTFHINTNKHIDDLHSFLPFIHAVSTVVNVQINTHQTRDIKLSQSQFDVTRYANNLNDMLRAVFEFVNRSASIACHFNRMADEIVFPEHFLSGIRIVTPFPHEPLYKGIEVDPDTFQISGTPDLSAPIEFTD